MAAQGGKLPDNVDPANSEARRPRGARPHGAGLRARPDQAVAAMCCRCSAGTPRPRGRAGVSEKWKTRRGQLFLVPGDSPVGYRLPLGSLPYVPPAHYPYIVPLDPSVPRGAAARRATCRSPAAAADRAQAEPRTPRASRTASSRRSARSAARCAPRIAVEPRDGRLCVFMPPVEALEDYLELVAAAEAAAEADRPAGAYRGLSRRRTTRASTSSASRPIPASSRSTSIRPRAGAIASTPRRRSTRRRGSRRLGADKFMIDGRHTGTGGGNHVVVGGATPDDSPFLRRPDLLKSLVLHWQRHPVAVLPVLRPVHRPDQPGAAHRRGAPRQPLRARDRDGAGAAPGEGQRRRPGWSTGCSATCWSTSPATPTAPRSASTSCIRPTARPAGSASSSSAASRCRPMPRMSLAQQLLVRALIARFWREPHDGRFVRWGTALHDRFMLPHFVWAGLPRRARRPRRAHGFAFEPEWFEAQLEFRFPFCGEVEYEGVKLELRQALEPWHVMGETRRHRRHRALRRLLGRTAAGQGSRASTRSATSSPATAAACR